MWSGQGTDERLARFCERAESGRRSDVYLGRFWRLYGGFRDSTIRRAEQAARPRASRIRGVVPAGGRMMESRALRADIRGAICREKFPLAVEK